ncbi:hypothetical protein [Crinalium epipsammum]|nr:hypothetical protein [Crinalium epipsammum]
MVGLVGVVLVEDDGGFDPVAVGVPVGFEVVFCPVCLPVGII